MTLQVTLLENLFAGNGVLQAKGSVQAYADDVAQGLVDDGRATPFGLGWIQPLTALRPAEAEAFVAASGGPRGLLDSASAGTSSAWVPYLAGMRLAWQLDTGTTSTTFSIDMSADGVSSLGQAFTGVWDRSTVAEISPPIYLTNPLARFIRFNVLTGGPLSVDRSV
jgi:hypothetical protein